MEMERINDNLIKVYIDVVDLEERGINFLEMISDQKNVEKFFYSILEEVDVERQFYDSEALTFQVIPSNDGIELFISKSSFDEIDQLFESEIIQKIRERKQSIEDSATPSKPKSAENDKEKVNPKQAIREAILNSLRASKMQDEQYIDKIVKFETLDDFIQFARDEKDSGITGDLYYMNESYFFVITQVESIEVGSLSYYSVVKMLEYGVPHSTTAAILEEHGERIHAHDTIEYFGYHF